MPPLLTPSSRLHYRCKCRPCANVTTTLTPLPLTLLPPSYHWRFRLCRQTIPHLPTILTFTAITIENITQWCWQQLQCKHDSILRVCVTNFNSMVKWQMGMMWHKTLNTQIQIMWHNVWENFNSTKKWQMGTMWHITQNTQIYLTKQNLLRTLFLQPTRQRVFSPDWGESSPKLPRAYNTIVGLSLVRLVERVEVI